jgi:uncharacterized repeat protein (TIGR03803 family)
LTLDDAGNFYGTTAYGGYVGGDCNNSGCGTVFELMRSGSEWSLATLYSFTWGADGAFPQGTVVLAPDGSLYGTTQFGGIGSCVLHYGCGTVFQLARTRGPSKVPEGIWNKTVVHYFAGQSDGGSPQGDLILDQSGNIYGIAMGGGWPASDCGDHLPYSCGTVYALTPSGAGWLVNVLHYFRMAIPSGGTDGGVPAGGVIFDTSGNLYGVTEEGGRLGFGTVYRLSPFGGRWMEKIINDFTITAPYNDSAVPIGGLIMDSFGNLYGTSTYGGDASCDPPYGCGTVFELTPASNGKWLFRILYNFSGHSGCNGWCAPHDKLVMDAAGHLYGTTTGGGAYDAGNVFELSPAGGGWVYTSLHDFTGQYGSDGAFPVGSLVFDGAGNLYGTASQGGSSNAGVIFAITP